MKENFSMLAKTLISPNSGFRKLDEFICHNYSKIADAFDINLWWHSFNGWWFNKEGNAIILDYKGEDDPEIPISELNNLDEFLRNLKQKREAKKKAEELEWKKNQLNYFAKKLNMTVVEK